MPSVLLRSNAARWAGLALSIFILLLLAAAGVLYGSKLFSLADFTGALTRFQGTNDQIIIKDVRIPRVLIAACVGASLGAAGVLLQALTRNPVAEPGIFGLNAGAGLSIVLAVTLFGTASLQSFTWIAFLGTALSGAAVYFLGSLGRGGLSPVRVTLAGAAVTALATSFIQTVLVVDQRTTEEVLFWLSGSVEGRKLTILYHVLPFMAAGWAGTLLLSSPMNTLMLGDDVAKGLGQRTVWVKAGMAGCIILLVGASVAAAGPIAFIGLIVPHLARYVAGGDLRWMTAYSLLLGAIMLILADIAGRFVAMPNEMPIGVMTALLGAPFFIYTARKGLSR
ncbi:FecCD family ABC transporter permease [Paenibacillus gansuensis]|uniref:FecCD family ABC transporter permease n=1 Tax=Paenibacillus gansuensis TaxID=306542 RepID=A0ABW5P9Q3_9BACL